MITRKGRCRLKWVSELLDQDGRDWDLGRLQDNFHEVDVDAITKIKLPQRSSDDFLAWHMEKTGRYTVRNAYNLALKLVHEQDVQASSTAPDGERKLWKLVGSGRVPPKVNIFAWKLARDILPTRHAKFRRHL